MTEAELARKNSRTLDPVGFGVGAAGVILGLSMGEATTLAVQRIDRPTLDSYHANQLSALGGEIAGVQKLVHLAQINHQAVPEVADTIIQSDQARIAEIRAIPQTQTHLTHKEQVGVGMGVGVVAGILATVGMKKIVDSLDRKPKLTAVK